MVNDVNQTALYPRVVGFRGAVAVFSQTDNNVTASPLGWC
jgi:hypothetical protein